MSIHFRRHAELIFLDCIDLPVLSRFQLARSELVVPLTVKKQVIGILDIQSDKLNDFDETDLVVMQSLASQAAISIENARLYEQTKNDAETKSQVHIA